jgi:DNA-binding NarL/FixJ family response regulator
VKPVRVLVVDDHFVVRKGVCALLAGTADIAVVGEAEDGLLDPLRRVRLRLSRRISAGSSG